MKKAHIIAATAVGSWATTGTTVIAGTLGWIHNIHPNLTILACTISGTATVCALLCGDKDRRKAATHAAMATLGKLEETADTTREAVDELNRTAIAPVKEAFICGVQLGEAKAANGDTVVIPRQIYTADTVTNTAASTLLPTADGATTVELPRCTDDGPTIDMAISSSGRHHSIGRASIADTGNVHPLRHSSRPGPKPRRRRVGGMPPSQPKPNDPTND